MGPTPQIQIAVLQYFPLYEARDDHFRLCIQ